MQQRLFKTLLIKNGSNQSRFDYKRAFLPIKICFDWLLPGLMMVSGSISAQLATNEHRSVMGRPLCPSPDLPGPSPQLFSLTLLLTKQKTPFRLLNVSMETD